MAKSIIQYDLLISCPGDIVSEIEVIDEAVAQFNTQFSDALSLTVRPKHWSKNSYPESGDKPQNLLNKQFATDCDAAVAIFWTRFGTPTDEYGSGTEEEIEEMIEAGKQVFMYFSEKPLSPSQAIAATEEYKKVQCFKERYKNKGIYYTYSSDDELEKQFFAHLSQYFLSLKKVQEIELRKIPKLSVKSITDEGFREHLKPCSLIYSSYLSADRILDEVKELFDQIERYNVYRMSNDLENTAFTRGLYKPVEIKEEKKKWITSFAEKIGYELSSDFFFLGSLRESIVSGVLMGGRNLEGEEKEEAKYWDILKLHDKSHSYAGWFLFESMFGNLSCIRLAAINEGTTFDEDIEITLTFPSNMIILHWDLPIPEQYAIEQIEEDSSLREIFGISGTAKYNDYESSNRHVQFQTAPPSIPSSAYLFGGGRDYKEEYLDDLDEIFDYKIFDEGDFKVVKLHIDYLKHNTAVAFPTVIFVTENLSDVPYTISSKHGDSVVRGILTEK